MTGGIVGAATLLAVNFLVVRFLYQHEKVDQIVEGSSTVLIENGKILKRRLAKELLTTQELEAAAHKQGLGSLAEVDKAILDPSGVICFIAKQPPPEEKRHRELLARIDQLGREIAQLRLGQAPPSA